MKVSKAAILLISTYFIVSCSPSTSSKDLEGDKKVVTEEKSITNEIIIEAEKFSSSSDTNLTAEPNSEFVELTNKGWLGFDVSFETAGRYKVEVIAKSTAGASVWLEDYIDNKDGRTYNVTGSLKVNSKEFSSSSVDGSPFNKGTHKMKLHYDGNDLQIDKIKLTLMIKHQLTPETLTQNMEGEEWELVWSDEFEGETLDTTKWLYDVGNWGWGNNELQYYTDSRTENTRLEEGNLIIEARKNDMGQEWTSARLTTRGKTTFLYGKIEFKAIVPREKGNWAAGWTLGDSYVDELSWPYCGEIDIMESVGYEVNDETGDGISHATVHTPAYYFKINNQISSTKEVKNIAGEFHTYAVEWTPTEIKGLVDDEVYYLYDKTANEKEWPFNKPQNIILNLAMGGGWGGAQGMDTSVTSQKLVIDYVRVYGKK